MSTEEKATKNPEKTETPKPKRRFKFDKKHIQGFIAGILVAAIAFTGLYYGTEGRFFKGTIGENSYLGTDANFEDLVIKSELPVLVLFCVPGNRFSDRMWMHIRDSAQYYDDIFKFAYVYVGRSPEVTTQYSISNNQPTCIIFRDGKIIDRKEGFMEPDKLYFWLSYNFNI